jgi:hypothetical protein
VSLGATCIKCSAHVPATGRKYCDHCNPNPTKDVRVRLALAAVLADLEFLRKDNARLRAELALSRQEVVNLKWKGRAA